MKPARPDKELIDPLEAHVGRQLRRASFAIMSALQDAFAAIGLRSSEAVVIRFVAANPRCTQSEVSRALEVQRTNMVPIVSGLVKRGLLVRSRLDGRTQMLEVTPGGLALNEKILAIGQQHEAHVFGDLSDLDRKEVLAFLRKTRSRAQGFRPAG